ncbi:MAG: aldo/keto reductase [Gemmatimonadales bacterium]|nr:MAG: aldo/keto reductase [Gemmatimonadales bacterium]
MLHGGDIPRLGLGLFRTGPGAGTENAIRWALELGIRHLDTASMYGNEEEVGRAVRASGISRDRIFVTSKLWNDDHGHRRARKALEASLERLDLGWIDLYLIHFPVPHLRRESWEVLEEALDEGLVRAIGVSNYMVHHLEELLGHARIPPAVNQIELHPFNARTRSGVVDFCRRRGIVVEAYSPLTKARRLDDPVLREVAEARGRTPAQILIRYGLDKGWVTLPKSSDRNRIRENADVVDWSLTAEEMARLDDLDEGLAVTWDPTDAP